MFRLFTSFIKHEGRLAPLVLAAIVFAVGVASAQSKAAPQQPARWQASPAAIPNQPLIRDYKGVTIGMRADEARQKLGEAQEKSDLQEFFVFSDKESVQVYYDKDQKVHAISINFMGDESAAPTAISVIGTEIEPKPDGSMHKLVRYPEAGYWVSYSKTAGETPLITVTMQRMDANQID